MGFLELLIIAVGVSMDAFAVSICKGLSTRQVRVSDALTAGLWFGGFQALMPLIGFYLGVSFADFVAEVDHWIAFVLLGIIGAKMIKESFENESCDISSDFSCRSMLPMAIATSIDAFAVGITYAVLKTDILIPVIMIGVTAFIFTIIGLYLGKKIGNYFGDKFEILGGVILILLGVKILLEGLGILVL